MSIIKNPFNESTSKNNFPPLDPMFETSDEESLIENQDDDDFIEEKSVEYRSAMNNRKLDVFIFKEFYNSFSLQVIWKDNLKIFMIHHWN